MSLRRLFLQTRSSCPKVNEASPRCGECRGRSSLRNWCHSRDTWSSVWIRQSCPQRWLRRDLGRGWYSSGSWFWSMTCASPSSQLLPLSHYCKMRYNIILKGHVALDRTSWSIKSVGNRLLQNTIIMVGRLFFKVIIVMIHTTVLQNCVVFPLRRELYTAHQVWLPKMADRDWPVFDI